MTRAKFDSWSDCGVDVEFDDDSWGRTIRRRYSFSAPKDGGYVRELNSNRQLCDHFADRGPTLLWNGRGKLVDYIRAEYRRMRAADRRRAIRDAR
jgi:hypothetical protein